MVGDVTAGWSAEVPASWVSGTIDHHSGGTKYWQYDWTFQLNLWTFSMCTLSPEHAAHTHCVYTYVYLSHYVGDLHTNVTNYSHNA